MDYIIDPQLFAEGAAAAAPAAEGAVAAPAGENEAETPAATVDLDAEFEEMIKGKYKDQYGKRVADTVSKRVKSLKGAADKYEALKPALDTLYSRYNVDPSDPNALKKAVDSDRAFIEAKAYELGMTPEQYEAQLKKDFHARQIEREYDELKKQIQDAQSDEIIRGWRADAEALRSIYPQIDFDTEMRNPTFTAALRDLPEDTENRVKAAYEIAHWGEIGPQMMQYAQKVGEQNVAASVAANGMRPVEGGAAPQGTGAPRFSPKDTTLAQREEIDRRVQRGEHVTFG